MRTRTRAGLLAGLSPGDWPELSAILETLLFVGCQQVGAATDGEVGRGETRIVPTACAQQVSCVCGCVRVCWCVRVYNRRNK